MAATSAAASLLQILTDEALCVGQFVELLKDEQKSLAKGASDELPALAESKAKLAPTLGSLAAQRNEVLAKEGLAVDRPGIEAWCAKHPKDPAVALAWAKIIALASEARELNRVNGELIALRMQYNAKALEALRGGANPLDLYGPDGQSTAFGGRRINDSV